MKSKIEEQLIKKLYNCNAFKDGHFELSSGKHSSHYVQCAQFCKFPHLNRWAAFNLCNNIKQKPDLVVSPAIGGLLIGYAVASHLEVPFIFVERDKGAGPLVLRRDFEINPGTNVLIVEDVITTGKSTLEVVNVVNEYEANVISIACIIDRTNGCFKPNAEFNSLLSINSISYDKEECPLCKEGQKAVKPGSRYL